MEVNSVVSNYDLPNGCQLINPEDERAKHIKVFYKGTKVDNCLAVIIHGDLDVKTKRNKE